MTYSDLAVGLKKRSCWARRDQMVGRITTTRKLFRRPASNLRHAQRPPRQRLSGVLSMFSSLRVKVPVQPDGGEGLEMMQGLPSRGGV